MPFYPPKISERVYAPARAGRPVRSNAAGTGASFVCGVVVRFFLFIDVETKEILEVGYGSNGCGFAVAAADVLAEQIAGRRLPDLHGLDRDELLGEIASELGGFPEDRDHCARICLDALEAALADFRAYQLEEFAGEKALICTCFGISEETVERVIAENQSDTIEEVGEICRAGTGCGSCQFLIQELIDICRNEKA